jgi:hypothetical protein
MNVDNMTNPEGVLLWFGDQIMSLYQQAQKKDEKPSVMLNSVSRAVDSWGRLYGNHVQNSRIEELSDQLNQITRDLGKGEIKAIK